MPNWCYTRIIFHGNKNEIEDFRRKVDHWTSSNLSKTDFGNNWLGNILIGAGLGDKIDAREGGLRCRGSVDYVDDVEDLSDTESAFSVDVETAWAPMMSMWVEVIKKLEYKTIGFSFIAEEPGCELYQIYDPYGDFPERYYVDIWLEEEDENDEKMRVLYDVRYFESDESLLNVLRELFEDNVSDLTTLIKKTKDYPFKNKDSYVLVHKYDLLNEDEIY